MTEDKSKLCLLLGFHGHLPLNNLQNNTENEIIQHYLSLVEIVNNFKNIKTNIHLSGSLITYLDKNFHDFSPKIRNLLDSNQIELFGGGRYEPILPFIPKEDRESQLLLMNRLLNHTYGYTPLGAWITGSAWEPNLTLDLAKSKIQYICLPKEYFNNTGLEEKEISGYYITEEEGRKLGVFPISLELGNLIEQFSPEDTIKHLLKDYNNNQYRSIAVFYSNSIYNKTQLDWLTNFFELIDKNSDLLETRLFNDYFSSHKPKGRIYLPTILPTKQFLVTHPEANLVHKKMLRVSKKINSAKEGKSRFKVIKEMITQAQDLLLKGQSSNIYSDNDHTGIYSARERHNIYSNLIKAENLIDAASRQGSKWIQVSEIDYDCDGNDEIIIETKTQNIYISPGLGGTILEHDYRPKNINLIGTTIKSNLDINNSKKYNSNLNFDNYLKLNLVDHFLQNDLDIESCQQNKLIHLTNEIISPYSIEKIKAKEEICKISLLLNARLIKLENNPQITLTKQISTCSGDSSMLVDYILINKSEKAIDFTFAVEFNLNFTTTYDKDSYFYLDNNPNNKTKDPDLISTEIINEINQISIHNNIHKIDLTLSWSKACNIFRFPILTRHGNNGNYQELYQGNTILSFWHLILDPNTSWELSIKQDISTRTEEL